MLRELGEDATMDIDASGERAFFDGGRTEVYSAEGSAGA